MPDTSKKIFQKPHVWTFTTYFAEGFPYTIIRTISSVFFRDMKVSLEAIGLTSLFGLPWVLKFLWGPQIDQFATKRRWMLSMQLMLILVFSVVAFVAPLERGVEIIAILFFAGAFLAATHDMAIDGYYMEALDKEDQSRFVGYRVMAYRISMMAGTGVIVTIGAKISWRTGFLCAALLLGILYIYHLFLLPKVETRKTPIRLLLKSFSNFKWLIWCSILCLTIIFIRWVFSCEWWENLKAQAYFIERVSISGWVGIGLLMAVVIMVLFKDRIKGVLFKDTEAFYTRAFMTYMDRKGIGIIISFIILMRTGEAMLASMASPFMVDLGLKAHYGWISGGVGLPFSIIGAMLGGWMISRYTLKKTMLPFLLAQNLTNVVYMALALMLNHYLVLNTGADCITPIGRLNLFLVAFVHAFDQFAGGLGTAVLITFLMRTCLSEFKAAHFAIGTGLMNISAVLSGVMSGFLAQWLGYGYFFGISFLVSIPGMILIFFLPYLEPESEPLEKKA
ncbi:MAG: MFS transporter [Deltaproteobacteria bacterium]|nr:MFS transporter [Deltaproteobacteria bacterium]